MKEHLNKRKILMQTTKLDVQTGEVVSEEKEYQLPIEPDFIKLYIDTMLTFKDVSKSFNPILIEFLKRMPYANGGEQKLYINSGFKDDVSKRLGISIKRVEQAITDFVKKDIFLRVNRGTYMVNPHLFGRGSWRDIYNIRAKFDFKKNTIEAEIISREQAEKEEAEAKAEAAAIEETMKALLISQSTEITQEQANLEGKQDNVQYQ